MFGQVFFRAVAKHGYNHALLAFIRKAFGDLAGRHQIRAG